MANAYKERDTKRMLKIMRKARKDIDIIFSIQMEEAKKQMKIDMQNKGGK